MVQRRMRGTPASTLVGRARAAILAIAAAVALPLCAQVRVGMAEPDLLASKGKPAGSVAVGGKVVYEWPDMRVMVQAGKVVKVTYTGEATASTPPAAVEIKAGSKTLNADIRKEARARYEASQANKVIWARHALGEKAPAFEVEKWLTPEPVTSGKFILIDFWATWCGPCRTAIPVLNKISRELGDRLTIIGVSNEAETDVRRMKTPEIAYSVAIDTQERMETSLAVKGIPHAILVDPSGVIRWEGYPLSPGNELTLDLVRNVMDLYAPEAPAKH